MTTKLLILPRKKIEAPTLKDVSLAAIVRDEMINPAGGIVDFVASTVPFVEEAIIVDTGSADGTRETLEELERAYPNLSVHDRKFVGFADARNYSLEKVGTKRALVLDTDERLTRADFETLKVLLENTAYPVYKFYFLDVYPDGKGAYGRGHSRRLFDVCSNRFVQEIWEGLDNVSEGYPTQVFIKHFLPAYGATDKKRAKWYFNVFDDNHNFIQDIQPSEVKSFKEWKKPHPKKVRERYR